MGLFVLKDSSEELLQLSFEEILNEITEKPKAILAPKLSIVVGTSAGSNSDSDQEERKQTEESKEPLAEE